MDYIMFDRIGNGNRCAPEDNRRLVFSCPKCKSRIWGQWRLPSLRLRSDSLCYLNSFSRDCSRAYFDLQDGYAVVKKELERVHEELSEEGYAALDLIDRYRKEALQFCKLSVCPACGAKLTKKNLRSWCKFEFQGWNLENWSHKELESYASIDEILAYDDRKLAQKSSKAGKEKYRNFLQKCLDAETSITQYRIDGTEQLKCFLKHLVAVEKNIYSVSERLQYLYQREMESKEKADESLCAKACERRVELIKLYDQLEEIKGRDWSKEVVIPPYNGRYPTKPIAPIAPSMPILSKPGFFNKKKIIAQNNASMEIYDKQCTQYKTAMEEYNSALVAYNSDLVKIKKEQEERRLKLIRQAQATAAVKCKRLEEAYLAAKKEIDQFDASNLKTAAVIQFNVVRDEIVQAEKLLQELYQTRKQMYGSGVIFEKYHNFVAVSSFCEYITSGRCDSLDGVRGAYNLYENEIRMNAIISQLSDVVKSMKQIQKNQFVIYSAITQATNELATLKKSTEAMSKSLKTMEQNVTNISENAKIIAHNSEITAYYTKKNAELTDAIGYLIELK